MTMQSIVSMTPIVAHLGTGNEVDAVITYFSPVPFPSVCRRSILGKKNDFVKGRDWSHAYAAAPTVLPGWCNERGHAETIRAFLQKRTMLQGEFLAGRLPHPARGMMA